MRKRNPYLTPINLTLIVINAVIFIVLEYLGNTEDAEFMFRHGALFPPSITESHEYYRFFTSVFIHFGWSHIGNNMVMLFFLGSYLEDALGKIKYLCLYLTTGISSSVISFLVMMYHRDYAVSGGASGAIFGVIGALLYIVIRNHGKFEGLTTQRFVLMIALSLYYGYHSSGVDNAAHVGGLVTGFIFAIFLYRTYTEKKETR